MGLGKVPYDWQDVARGAGNYLRGVEYVHEVCACYWAASSECRR
jgi:hypothetical protein